MSVDPVRQIVEDRPDQPSAKSPNISLRSPFAASVSVVIPVRDGARHLSAAMASALKQPEVAELLVIDDGSTDATADVVRACSDGRVRYTQQGRLGAAQARNQGVLLATAPFLAFLDADDIWLCGKLAGQCPVLAAGDADLVFTQIEEFISPELSPAEASALRPREGVLNGVSVVTMLMHRADFARVGPFDGRIRTGEFLHWYARAQELGLRSVTLPRLLARRRLHGTNHGRTHAAERPEYATILREMLIRRRDSTQP